MPGAQRKPSINVSYHLDAKENTLTGKPPTFNNNNTVFHDGLPFSHAESSTSILTPSDLRGQSPLGVPGGGRKTLAFYPLIVPPGAPPPTPPCHPGLRSSPGPIPFPPAASPQQPPPVVAPQAQAPCAGLPGRNPIRLSAPHLGPARPDERWPGTVRGLIVSGPPRPRVRTPRALASQHWARSFHFIHHQSHLAEAILTKSACVSKAIKRRKEFC